MLYIPNLKSYKKTFYCFCENLFIFDPFCNKKKKSYLCSSARIFFNYRCFERHFERAPVFRKVFLREQIFWFLIYCCWVVWLLFKAFMVFDWYGCIFYLYLTLLFSSYFYLFIRIHKTLWPNRQDKRLLSYKTFKNAGSKPARSKTFASKRGLDT